MNILLPLIVLVILAVIYAGSLNNPRSRLCVVVVVLILILLLCWMQMQSSTSLEGFQLSGYAPLDYKLRITDDANSGSSCDGYNYTDINSQISPLGTYDGIVLKSKIATAPLMNKVFLTSPVGDDIQLTQDPTSRNFPTVDGTPNTDKHLFVFANNNSGIGCRSQYSTSTGQVCISPEQLNMFMHRGKNLTAPQEYPAM